MVNQDELPLFDTNEDELVEYFRTPVRFFAHEMIEVYDLKGNFKGIWSRKAYYAKLFRECKTNPDYVPEFQVRGIRLQLVNPNGELYLQRRSANKRVNGGLIDKTLGGHVKSGMSYDETLLDELKDELGFNSSCVVMLDNSELTSSRLKDYNLENTLVCTKENEEVSWWCERVIYNSNTKGRIIFNQPWINSSYIGFYDGDLNIFPDGECEEVILMKPDRVIDELERDIHVETYCPELKYFITLLMSDKYRGLFNGLQG